MDGLLTPSTPEGAAAGLAAAAAAGSAVRFRGGGSKLGWGAATATPPVELCLERLDRTLEHNVGDLTAIFEAGAPMQRIQQELAAAGQMLALDPPLGAGQNQGATIGGVIATADSGPLRHRYGAPRDLILGVTVGLSDGTIARAGSKVIKNVAGYDLAKLFTGSFGTLGVILSVSVRLHPLPGATATALGACDDPALVTAAASALAAAPLELDSLDLAWRGGRGGVLARSAGAEAQRRSETVATVMRRAGLEHVEITADDDPLWARQRAGQRSATRALVRIAARPSELEALLGAVDVAAGTLVGRAALGISYVELDPEAVQTLRGALPSSAVLVLLDGPGELRAQPDPWGSPDAPLLELMRRVKQRFDPVRACNPGVFVGGI
ncbi:MAG: FAD-binding oxidoreductase [Actinomycetota bacterium]|nr:FAD-binding oxidoreductase [Actinomycetota bacterium]